MGFPSDSTPWDRTPHSAILTHTEAPAKPPELADLPKGDQLSVFHITPGGRTWRASLPRQHGGPALLAATPLLWLSLPLHVLRLPCPLSSTAQTHASS